MCVWPLHEGRWRAPACRGLEGDHGAHPAGQHFWASLRGCRLRVPCFSHWASKGTHVNASRQFIEEQIRWHQELLAVYSRRSTCQARAHSSTRSLHEGGSVKGDAACQLLAHAHACRLNCVRLPPRPHSQSASAASCALGQQRHEASAPVQGCRACPFFAASAPGVRLSRSGRRSRAPLPRRAPPQLRGEPHARCASTSAIPCTGVYLHTRMYTLHGGGSRRRLVLRRPLFHAVLEFLHHLLDQAGTRLSGARGARPPPAP